MPPIKTKKKLNQAKPLALREVAAKSSARKATGRHSAMAAQPAPASTDGMEVNQDLSTTESDTDTVATPSAPEGVNAEVILLHKQVAAMRLELEATQEVATGSSEVPAHIGCPRKYKSLQTAKGLKDNKDTYSAFRDDVKRFAAAANLRYMTLWHNRDRDKTVRVCRMVRKEHTFLKHYVRDWPVTECLKAHFANKQGYANRKKRENAAKRAAAHPKGKRLSKSMSINDPDDAGFGTANDSN